MRIGIIQRIIITQTHHFDMKLDKEQKRVLKAVWPTTLGLSLGYPLVSLIRGQADWKEALILLAGGLVFSILMALFYILGSKIPKKDE